MKSVKKVLAIFIALCMIVSFIPNVSKAGVTDQESDETGQIIRKTTTNYFTTVILKGTYENPETGEIEEYNISSEEIAGNYTDEDVVAKIESMKGEFQNWAEEKKAPVIEISEGGITEYYYDAHDEITQSNTETGSDVIFVGDIEDMEHAYNNQGQITINTILDKHQTFEIIATAGPYKLIDGADQEHKKNADSDLTFKANGNIAKVVAIKVDGTEIGEKEYTIETGSTIVTLKAAYLNTLEVGDHTLTIAYEDGEVETQFKIAPTNNPPTGDNIVLFAGLFIVSILGLAVVCKNK